MKLSWWQILLIAIVGLFIVSIVVFLLGGKGINVGKGKDTAFTQSVKEGGYYPTPPPKPGNDGFNPDGEDRKIVKTCSLTVGVPNQQEFHTATENVDALISSVEGYITNQNIGLSGYGDNQYYRATYTIRVETNKYDFVLSQLKSLGAIEQLNQSSEDITGEYTENELQIKEKQEEMYKLQLERTFTKNESKIASLNAQINNLKTQIENLQGNLEDKDIEIDYSTINFTLKEKTDSFGDSGLIGVLFGSFNVLLYIILLLLPWLVLGAIIYFIVRAHKRKKKR